MLAAGDTFGTYQIVRVLGEGGFATVYLAEDVRPAMSRRVALKVLDDRFVEDEEYRERFTRESRLAANLDHPNVAPIYDAGELEGRLYIAMRFIDGVDLKERIAQGELSAEECVAILRQIGSALDDAHTRGLIHRDVKPGNVLLDGGRADRVYLADFGITKEISDGKEFTQAGTFLGTLSYASPEQLEGRALDGRSDQYALSCLLYECLTGRPPFSGSLKDVLSAHLALPAPKVTSATDRFPEAIDAVVARGMSKAPEGRYATCSELADAAAAALLNGPAGLVDDDVTGETVILGTGLAAAGAAAVGVAASAADTGPEQSESQEAEITEPSVVAPADAAADPSDAGAVEVNPTEPATTEVSPAESVTAPPAEQAPASPPEPPRWEPPTPSPAGAAPSRGDGGGTGRGVGILLGLVALVAVLGLVTVLVLNTGSDDDAAPADTSATSAPAATTSAPATTTSSPASTTTTAAVTTTTASVPTFTGSSRTIQPIRTLAPASVPDTVDGCGVSRVYGPENLVDDDLETGWAMDGDGEGQRLRLNLGGPTRVNQVAITPGLAEPSCSSLDIFDEQRRLQSVRWVFSDGTDVQQTLDPTDPGLQAIDVDVVTSRVTVELGRTVDGGTIDVTAVAEIRVEGVLADAAP